MKQTKWHYNLSIVSYGRYGRHAFRLDDSKGLDNFWLWLLFTTLVIAPLLLKYSKSFMYVCYDGKVGGSGCIAILCCVDHY